MPSTVELVQSLVNGVGIGLVYGLIAIGFCVIYNASGIVNFAQGVFVMLGGMFTHAMLMQARLAGRCFRLGQHRSRRRRRRADAGPGHQTDVEAQGAAVRRSFWRRSRCSC